MQQIHNYSELGEYGPDRGKQRLQSWRDVQQRDSKVQWTGGICTGMNLTGVQEKKTREYAEDSEQSMQESCMTATERTKPESQGLSEV